MRIEAILNWIIVWMIICCPQLSIVDIRIRNDRGIVRIRWNNKVYRARRTILLWIYVINCSLDNVDRLDQGSLLKYIWELMRCCWHVTCLVEYQQVAATKGVYWLTGSLIGGAYHRRPETWPIIDDGNMLLQVSGPKVGRSGCGSVRDMRINTPRFLKIGITDLPRNQLFSTLHCRHLKWTALLAY